VVRETGLPFDMQGTTYFHRTALLLILISATALIPLTSVKGCQRDKPFTLDELFNRAEVIVRATAVKYAKAPNQQYMTTGVPDSTIEFRIEEKLRGGAELPETITINGYLDNYDDFNEVPVPYMFVRPNGRHGSCFANTYKQGAQFLLFLKKSGDTFTPNISALGPTNEQLHSDKDAWLVWVRNHLIVSTVDAKHAPADWSHIKACGISFLAPVDLADTGKMGIDSCIKQFKNKDIVIYIDYGWFGRPFVNEDRDSGQQSFTIDGRTAQVVTYIDASHGNTGLDYNAFLYALVNEADRGRPNTNSLMMSVIGQRPKDQDTALAIFRTIRFQ
jgi:hypothetical protein